MSNAPFDRTILNALEKGVVEDINKAQAQLDRSLRDIMRALLSPAVGGDPYSNALDARTGFIADGYQVRQKGAPGLFVLVTGGFGFFKDGTQTADIGGVPGLNDFSAYKPLYLSQDETIAVPTPDPVNPRIDIVEVKMDRFATDSAVRSILDVPSRTFVPTAVNKTLSYDMSGRSTVNGVGSLNYKSGVAGAAPAVPATTAGYVKIAEIAVPAAAASVTIGNIADKRFTLGTGGMRHASIKFSMTSAGAGTALPLVQHIMAPPGCRLAVSGTQKTGAVVEVALLAGEITRFTAVAQNNETQFNAIFTTSVFNPRIEDMSGALATALANAAITAPAIGGVANNAAPFANLSHKVGRVTVSTQRLTVAGGAGPGNGTFDSVLNDPFNYTVHLYFE